MRPSMLIIMLLVFSSITLMSFNPRMEVEVRNSIDMNHISSNTNTDIVFKPRFGSEKPIVDVRIPEPPDLDSFLPDKAPSFPEPPSPRIPGEPILGVMSDGATIRGDFVVSGNVTIVNETLYVEGDIIILENSTLHLINSSLVMCLIYDGQYGISVLRGGALILENSEILSSRAEVNYYIKFFHGSIFEMSNSSIMYAGYSWGRDGDLSGLWIYSSEFRIVDSTILGCWAGVFAYNSTGYISGLSISDCFYGVVSYYSENITIEDTEGISLLYGVYVVGSTDVVLRNTNISDAIYGIYCRGSRDVVIDDCSLGNNTYNVFVFSCHNVEMGNVYADGDFFGIIVHGSENVTIYSSQATNNNVSGVLVHSTRDIELRSLVAEGNMYGVLLLGSNNVSISSVRIDNSVVCGLYIRHSWDVSIRFLVARYNGDDGLAIYGSHGIDMLGLLFVGNGRDAFIGVSYNISIYNITIRFGGFISNGTTFDMLNVSDVDVELVFIWSIRENSSLPGMSILFSEDVNIRYGFLYNCPIIVYDTNITRLFTINITGVLLDLAPVVFLKNENNVTVDGFSQALILNCTNIELRANREVYDIHVFFSSNITIRDVGFHRSTYGITVSNSRNVIIENVLCVDCGVGIYADYSSNIIIANSTVESSIVAGFFLLTENISIRNISIENMSNAGLVFSACRNVNVSLVGITNVDNGIVINETDHAYLRDIHIDNSTHGVLLDHVDQAWIIDTHIVYSSYGVTTQYMDHLSIVLSSIHNCSVGLSIYSVTYVIIDNVSSSASDYGVVLVDSKYTWINCVDVSSMDAVFITDVSSVYVLDSSLSFWGYGLVIKRCSLFNLSDTVLYGGYLSVSLENVSEVRMDNVGIMNSTYAVAGIDINEINISGSIICNVSDTALHFEDTGNINIWSIAVVAGYGLYVSNALGLHVVSSNISAIELGVWISEIITVVLDSIYLQSSVGGLLIGLDELSIEGSVVNTYGDGIYIQLVGIVALENTNITSGGIAIWANYSGRLNILYSSIVADIGIICGNLTWANIVGINIDTTTIGIFIHNVSNAEMEEIGMESSVSIHINTAGSVEIRNITIIGIAYGIVTQSTKTLEISSLDSRNYSTSMYLDSVRNIKIEDSHFWGVNGVLGIYTNNSDNITIMDSTFVHINSTMVIYNSWLITISEVSINNSVYGIQIYDSYSIDIENTYISGSTYGDTGILLNNSGDIEIRGIILGSFSIGIRAYGSSGIGIIGSNITHNGEGILLNNTRDVKVCFNNITENNIGLIVESAEGQNGTIVIHYNNFINNTKHAYDYGSVVWNLIAGNYWSDNTNIQDLDENNVSEIPYPIEPEGYDYRPLIYPVRIYDVKPPQYELLTVRGDFSHDMELYWIDLVGGVEITVGLIDASDIQTVILRYTTQNTTDATWMNTTMEYEYYIGFTQYFTTQIEIWGKPAQAPDKLYIEIWAVDLFGNSVTITLELDIRKGIPIRTIVGPVRRIGIGGGSGLGGIGVGIGIEIEPY